MPVFIARAGRGVPWGWASAYVPAAGAHGGDGRAPQFGERAAGRLLRQPAGPAPAEPWRGDVSGSGGGSGPLHRGHVERRWRQLRASDHGERVLCVAQLQPSGAAPLAAGGAIPQTAPGSLGGATSLGWAGGSAAWERPASASWERAEALRQARGSASQPVLRGTAPAAYLPPTVQHHLPLVLQLPAFLVTETSPDFLFNLTEHLASPVAPTTTDTALPVKTNIHTFLH